MKDPLETIPVCPLCRSNGTGRYRAGTARCAGCGFVFALPYCSVYGEQCSLCGGRCRRGAPGLPAHYSGRTAGQRLKVEAARLRRIESLAGPLRGLAVTETGAGVGALANLLLEAGADYEGYEPAPQLYEESRRQFPSAAARIKNSLPPADGRRCDLAVAVDVLEYVEGPAAFLAGLASGLRPGGAIYLEVPDESMFWLRTAVRRTLRLYSGPLHPGHINFFSRCTLLEAAAAAGLAAKAAGKLSLLADRPRLEATLGSPLPAWAVAASRAAALSGADLALGQGNLYAFLRRAEEAG